MQSTQSLLFTPAQTQQARELICAYAKEPTLKNDNALTQFVASMSYSAVLDYDRNGKTLFHLLLLEPFKYQHNQQEIAIIMRRLLAIFSDRLKNNPHAYTVFFTTPLPQASSVIETPVSLIVKTGSVILFSDYIETFKIFLKNNSISKEKFFAAMTMNREQDKKVSCLQQICLSNQFEMLEIFLKLLMQMKIKNPYLVLKAQVAIIRKQVDIDLLSEPMQECLNILETNSDPLPAVKNIIPAPIQSDGLEESVFFVAPKRVPAEEKPPLNSPWCPENDPIWEETIDENPRSYHGAIRPPQTSRYFMFYHHPIPESALTQQADLLIDSPKNSY